MINSVSDILVYAKYIKKKPIFRICLDVGVRLAFWASFWPDCITISILKSIKWHNKQPSYQQTDEKQSPFFYVLSSGFISTYFFSNWISLSISLDFSYWLSIAVDILFLAASIAYLSLIWILTMKTLV